LQERPLVSHLIGRSLRCIMAQRLQLRPTCYWCGRCSRRRFKAGEIARGDVRTQSVHLTLQGAEIRLVSDDRRGHCRHC
jgi:hypothetical protein